MARKALVVRADLEDCLGVHRLAALAANPEALGIDQPVAGDDAYGEPGQVEILHAGRDVGLELGRQGCNAVLHGFLRLHPGSEACEREREQKASDDDERGLPPGKRGAVATESEGDHGSDLGLIADRPARFPSVPPLGSADKDKCPAETPKQVTEVS